MKHLLLVFVILSATACALPRGTTAPEQEPVDAALGQLEYQRDQPHKAANYLDQVPTDFTRVKTEDPAQSPEMQIAPKKGLFGFLKKPASKTSRFSVKTGKIVNKGTIIYQVGQGNTATVPTKTEAPVLIGEQNKATDNREAGSQGGAAGIGKGNAPSVSVKEVGPPWWVYGLLVLASVGGGWVLRSKATSWAWVPARWKLV